MRWFIADLRTGRQLQDIRPIDGDGKRTINTPEDLNCTLDLNDPKTIALGLRNTATVGKTILVATEGDFILGAGPIWVKQYDRDSAKLKLTAKGAGSYYDHRYVQQVLAKTVNVTDFTVPDPSDPSKTMPNPALTTSITGFDLGTVAKKLVQLAHTWTNGSIPVVFEDDRAGTHEENVIGAEFKNLGELIKQYTQREGGPDIRFLPRFTTDRLGIEWVLQTGTEADPLLASSNVAFWDASVRKPAISGLQTTEDASGLASLAWLTGGRKADEVLVARSEDDTLTDAGFPLFETVDSSHSSVDRQDTLDAYAREATLFGQRSLETWSFKAEKNRTPRLGSYLEGDWCDIRVARYGRRKFTVQLLDETDDGLFDSGPLEETDDGYYDPSPLPMDDEGYYLTEEIRNGQVQGDPYLIEGGTFRHRIVSMGWSVTSQLIDIQCMPKVGG